MSRPSLLLFEASSSSTVVGWWGGSKRPGKSGRADDRHRISFDCDWLSRHDVPLTGVVSVYEVAPRWNWNVAAHVEHAPTLAPVPDAIPLSGREARSLPPLEALCLYGGEVVHKWLSAARLQRSDYDQAAGLAGAREYQAHYQAHSPLYNPEPVAVLGGWHAMWPDDDYYIPREMRLVVWTLRDAEPWIEVFYRAGKFSGRVRTT